MFSKYPISRLISGKFQVGTTLTYVRKICADIMFEGMRILLYPAVCVKASHSTCKHHSLYSHIQWR